MPTKIGTSLAQLLEKKKHSQKFVNHEFQIFGNYLAAELDAPKSQTGLFIKLAKTEDRDLLHKVLEFVKGVYKPKSKIKLFLWKLKQLRLQNKEPKEKIVKEPEAKDQTIKEVVKKPAYLNVMTKEEN